MSNRNITDAQFEALLLGFSVPERDTYRGAKWQDYSDIVVVRENPEAFEDGLALKKSVLRVMTADSMTDYNNDCSDYDDGVVKLNAKYGAIAYTTTEIDALETHGYGLIGHRFTTFGDVITTTYSKDGENTVEIMNIADDVAAEDAKIRGEMGM